jgi:Rod binding domain-containing protein
MGDLRIASPAGNNQSLNQAQGTQAIQTLRSAQAQGGSSAKIDKAARDFESILVGQWLEHAEKSFGTVPGTDPDQESDTSHDQFQSIACQALAQGLSSKGGFGIASLISKQLKAAAERQDQEMEDRKQGTGQQGISKQLTIR